MIKRQWEFFMKVDIFDFDKTIVPFDCGSLFWLYSMIHYPWIIICWPYQLLGGILYALHIFDLTKMKGPFFSFIRLIPYEKAAKKFWDKYDKYVFDWAKKGNRERYTVVISASPEFLIKEIGKRIEIDDYISTKHAPDGKVIGKNCHDMEKVRLFREKYTDAQVVNVVSDSIKNDKYIFSLGENCYHAVKGDRIPFKYEDVYKEDKTEAKSL